MAETYVVFNVLQRGIWKNRTSPVVTRSFANVGKTPTDNSPYPPQGYRRQSNVVSSKYYEYDKSVDRSNKIAFGYNKNATLDLANVARTAFTEPTSLSYSTIKNQKLSLNINRVFTEDTPFSQYSSKFSKDYGIFYGYRTQSGSIKDITWKGVSIAEKDSLPTLYKFGSISKLTTKSLSFGSSTSTYHLRIYPNRVERSDGAVYYFDDSDKNCKVKFIYLQSQSPGGNGGRSNSWVIWHFIVPTYHYHGGSGGGSGAHSIDLLKIPQDGSYIQISIPPQPGKRYYESDNGSVEIKHNGSTMFTLKSGGDGQIPVDGGGTSYSGGYGGWINTTSSISHGDFYRQNIMNQSGARGCWNSNIGKAGDLPEKTFCGLLEKRRGDYITIPGVTGLYPPGFSQSYAAGPGASSYLARGGQTVFDSDGEDAWGVGAGGAGGSKVLFAWNYGGAGGGAYISLGY